MRQWVYLVAALLDPYCHLEVFLAHVTCHFFSGKSASGTSEEGGKLLRSERFDRLCVRVGQGRKHSGGN